MVRASGREFHRRGRYNSEKSPFSIVDHFIWGNHEGSIDLRFVIYYWRWDLTVCHQHRGGKVIHAFVTYWYQCACIGMITVCIRYHVGMSNVCNHSQNVVYYHDEDLPYIHLAHIVYSMAYSYSILWSIIWYTVIFTCYVI